MIDAALHRLEAALRDAGHPLLGGLSPGLSRATVDELVAPTGLELPDEVAAVWMWRNGVDPSFTAGVHRTSGSELLPGGYLLRPLELCVTELLEDQDRFPWDDLPHHSRDWFPFVTAGPDRVYADCAVERDAPVPLILEWSGEPNEPEDLNRRTVPSVASAVNWWAELLENGQWRQRRNGWALVDDPQRHPWL